MRFGSLFAGIGGLDLGLERAGMECAWQVEIDDWCRRVLAKHWPDVPQYADVRDVEVGLEPVDLICGGFPCQPFSLAGRRGGVADERWMWPEFERVVRLLRPRYVLVENVPGLLAGDGMAEVLGSLAALGFDAEWECIPAAAVGAPHLRWRVFIVAYAQRSGLEERASLRRNARAQCATAQRNGGALAHPDAGRRNGRSGVVGQGWGRQPANGSDEVVDPESIGRREGQGIFQRLGPAERGWWSSEPDVGRVASRVPPGLDGGGLDAHPECIAKARSAGLPQTARLRMLREYLDSSEASSGPERCHLCSHPLSGLPCQGGCSPWQMGARAEEGENLRCLQEGLLGLLARAGEDVRPFLSIGAGAVERTQAVGSRVQRLRGLGNAVVPQVAEAIGRMIQEHA